MITNVSEESAVPMFTVKRETVGFPETLVTTYETTRFCKLNFHHRKLLSYYSICDLRLVSLLKCLNLSSRKQDERNVGKHIEKNAVSFTCCPKIYTEARGHRPSDKLTVQSKLFMLYKVNGRNTRAID
jgi:hypothetical protein